MIVISLIKTSKPSKEINTNFSCFAFVSPKFAQIIKYFAQSCDCRIAAYRNSAKYLSCLTIIISVYMLGEMSNECNLIHS